MEIKHLVYLSLGSNIGNREENISNAIQLIDITLGKVLKIAKNYENPAVGFDSETLFLNTAIEVESSLSPIQLLEQLKGIESKLGRKQKIKGLYESRIIDIDIILYDDLIFNNEILNIPHPLFRKRDFVLIPLNEIGKKVIDPVTLLQIGQLAELIKS